MASGGLSHRWEVENINSEEDNTAIGFRVSKKSKNLSQTQKEFLEELKKDFKNQIREVEEKLGREMRVMQENLEKRFDSLVKEVQKNTEENNTLKSRIGYLVKEAQKSTEEKNFFKSRIGQMGNEVQKLIIENNFLKISIRQVEANSFMRHQEIVQQSQKIVKIEENVKYLLGKTIDLENRYRRDNLKVVGLPESHDQKKSLDVIFEEIIKENCPDILEPEDKIEIEKIFRSPPKCDPKMQSPRNVIAKLYNSQIKEKILLAARRKQFIYCGATVRIKQDLAASTLKNRRAWNMIFSKAKELGLQPRVTYPAKLSIILQSKKWAFHEIHEFQSFIMKRPDLNRNFNFQI
uniref:L1 transposable element RRM domain-containing protein n=1 Tax=Monodelphis domestica TaxID=13616 RepID=A0A5F8HH22_MONDO